MPPFTFGPLFGPLAKLYHYFPLHAPLTVWFINGPFGKFAGGADRSQGSKGWSNWLWVDGNWGWAVMELVSVRLKLLGFNWSPICAHLGFF